MRRFYVTTPIYYVNDVPHLGTSYTTIAADALRRYHLLRGDEVRMLTGTDEHGQKMEREAQARGVSPAQFVREMSDRFEAAWPALEVQTDDFIRTTQERHKRSVREVWQTIAKRGDLYEGTYEGWYCFGCEGYKTEKDLLPGNICPLHNRAVEWLKEDTFFFRLSKYTDRLLEHYRAHPGFVEPESRRNEVLSFVEGGLKDLSVSRTSFSWGVPVPGSSEHVMYVWFDALANYWTALQGSDETKKFWDDATIVHLVGKDILRFHAVYWPAFLMSAGLRLPSKVFAHGFLTYSGQKMSKSLRNAVDPIGIARAFGTAIGGGQAAGADVLRYQLLRAIAFGQDGDFDLRAMIERYNADLGKNLGNLLARTLGLCAKMTRGLVPRRGDWTPLETDLAAAVEAHRREAIDAWERIEPHRALERTWAIASAANQYVDRAAPWTEDKKGNGARVETILNLLLSVLGALSALAWPVLPSKADEMRRQLGLLPLQASAGKDWLAIGLDPRPAGEPLAPGAPLFPTIDEAGARALVEALTPRIDEEGADARAPVVVATATTTNAPVATTKAPPTSTSAAAGAAAPLGYDQFSAVDLRVGVVRSCERVPNKDKLLKLAVDLGEQAPRTIVAGLALTFEPAALVGKRVVVVANLAPREFGKGLVSHGMLLATGPSDKLTLATVDGDVAPGARLK
ncbi:MAG TPA: methionine--tRNA ligase [Polyangiaceae bacterium]|nr:methionine--tRNA ligase [Polyangiaceae bacterium]